MSTSGTRRTGGAQVWVALSIVYVVWGSTYLAIRVVVDDAPPLLAMGARFLAAGLLLAVVLAARHGAGALRPGRRGLGASALIGGLLLVGGNGMVAVAEQTVPSGLTALLVAGTALWLVVLRALTGDRPRVATVAGTVLGFAGIAVLALPGGRPGSAETWGVLLVLAASLSWACGSFFSSRLPLPRNPFVATAWEMLLAGGVLVSLGAARGELTGLDLGAVPLEAWAALGYLVVFGSIVAFSAYVWLLGNARISLVATYAYVNPVVAVLLGALLLGEEVTPAVLLGGAVVVVGVGLVVRTERSAPRPTPRPAPVLGPGPDAVG